MPHLVLALYPSGATQALAGWDITFLYTVCRGCGSAAPCTPLPPWPRRPLASSSRAQPSLSAHGVVKFARLPAMALRALAASHRSTCRRGHNKRRRKTSLTAATLASVCAFDPQQHGATGGATVAANRPAVHATVGKVDGLTSPHTSEAKRTAPPLMDTSPAFVLMACTPNANAGNVTTKCPPAMR